jgi:chaperone modulatory protein CbpM
MESRRYSIEEASSSCGINCEMIIHFVEEDWVKPINHQEMMLDDEDIARIRLINTLLDELEIDEEAVPVILHLIDEIHHLRFLLGMRDRN